MVFVSSLFITSLLVVGLVIYVLAFVTTNYSLDFHKVHKKFVHYIQKKTFINILYIYVLMFVSFLGTKLAFALTFILFILFSYSQPHNWSIIMEQKLISLPIAIRRFSLKRLLSENCIITHYTFHKYVYDLAQAQWEEFVTMYNDTILDVKIFLGLVDPTIQLTENQKNLYNLQKKFFKYKSVEEFLSSPELRSEEKVVKLYNMLLQSRDPKLMFNSVRRLPWKFKVNYESNFFFKNITLNLLVFYNFFKTVLVAILLMVVYFLYTIFFFKIQFLKQLSVWFVIGMLYFWLMSGFNFFVKRYQYGKFTSQIQRFWKRTNTCFWLIEGFLILLFFYYYLNSSQEPLYMYDYSALNQEYLVSLHTIGLNIILLALVIYFMYFTLLRLNSNSWTQVNLYLIIISVFIFFSFFFRNLSILLCN